MCCFEVKSMQSFHTKWYLCVGDVTFVWHTRAVRKVSSHFEYLENWSRGIDVTWQPVRGYLTAHPWTDTLPWD